MSRSRPLGAVTALVFDLDGTLVDTAPDLHAHLVDLLVELGRTPPTLEAVREMVGDGARALIERGLMATGGLPEAPSLDTLYATFLERYTAAPLAKSAVFEGVVEVLEGLADAGIKMGVCTNKPQVPTERILELLNLSRLLPVAVGGDALPVKKPDPGHLQSVLERLGTAGPAVMVGDSRNDLLSARAAGLPCILVSFGYTQVPAKDLGADLVIDHFHELPEALSTLPTR